jgi:hypothetical protein
MAEGDAVTDAGKYKLLLGIWFIDLVVCMVFIVAMLGRSFLFTVAPLDRPVFDYSQFSL